MLNRLCALLHLLCSQETSTLPHSTQAAGMHDLSAAEQKRRHDAYGGWPLWCRPLYFGAPFNVSSLTQQSRAPPSEAEARGPRTLTHLFPLLYIDQVNETIARGVALLNAALAVMVIVCREHRWAWYICILMAVDYALRVILGSRASVLGSMAEWVTHRFKPIWGQTRRLTRTVQPLKSVAHLSFPTRLRLCSTRSGEAVRGLLRCDVHCWCGPLFFPGERQQPSRRSGHHGSSAGLRSTGGRSQHLRGLRDV